MTTRIQLRRDTAANWASVNPVLAAGEPAVERDTGKLKVGDGTSAWASLPYILDVSDLIPIIEGLVAAAIPPGVTDEHVRDVVGSTVVGDLGDYIDVAADDAADVVRVTPGAELIAALAKIGDASELTVGTLPLDRIADGSIPVTKMAGDVATQTELDALASTTANNLATELSAKLSISDISVPGSSGGTALRAASEAVVRDELATASSPSRASLAGALAPVTSARPGNLCVFLGTSIEAGSDDVPNNARGEAWPVYASIMSGQRIRYVRNAGVAGDKTAQMLARFDTDVAPYRPTVVTIGGGPNDTGVTDFVTWQGQVKALVAKVRGIAAVPVLCTMPPNLLTSPTPDRRQLVVQWNGWLRRYAASEGIILLDFYAVLTDPATGGFLAAYAGDGTHPNAAGAAAMGAHASTVLGTLIPPNAPVLCQDDIDENNALYKGCFGGYTGSALPTGWIDNAGTPSGSVLSYTTDPNVRGQLVTLTHTAAAGPRQLDYACMFASSTLNAATSAGATTLTMTVNPYTRATLFIGTGATAEVAKVSAVSGSGSAWTVTLTRAMRYAHASGDAVVVNGSAGDQVVFAGVVAADGGALVTASLIRLPSGGPRAMSALSRAITRGVFLVDYTIPASTTELHPQLQLGAGTGVASFGQVGLYNVTRLGLLI